MTEFMIEGDINIAASRVLVPVAVATILPNVVMPVSGTVTTTSSGGTITIGTIAAVGTILSPVPTTILSGTISFLPANYVFTNVSAVIKGTPGTLWQINAAGESGLVAGAGTLLVLDAAATVLVMPLAAGGFQSAPFGPNGVNFGSLIASVIGNVDATFVIH
jgi:hypothetical protein